MKVKEENENVSFKLKIQKTKVMVSGPITSWQIDEEIMETVTDFILGSSKITTDSDCSHEIKRHFSLWKKSYDKLSMLESRNINLLTKVHIIKAMIFPIATYGCESWTIKMGEG